MSSLSDEDLDKATQTVTTPPEADTKASEEAEETPPVVRTTAAYEKLPAQEGVATSPEVINRKSVSKELHKQFTTLIGYADGLPIDDTNEEEPRAVAKQLDKLVASGALTQQERKEALQVAFDLRLHTDEVKLRRLTGMNIILRDVDGLNSCADDCVNNSSSEECQGMINALQDDIEFETISRDEIRQFKTAILKRYHLLIDMGVYTPLDQKPKEETPSQSEESQSEEPSEKPDVPTQAGGRVIPLTREGSLAPTLEAHASEPPTDPTPHLPQESTGLMPKLKQLGRSGLAWMKFLMRHVSTIALGFVLLFILGNLLMSYYEQTAPKETSDTYVHIPDAPNAPAVEPLPHGATVPTQGETSAMPIFPMPQPAALPALNCLPYTETDRCATTTSDAVVSEEMMATCTNRQAHPSFSQEEHPAFWDCGGVSLDLDTMGRQDVCQPSCCFCRYQ